VITNGFFPLSAVAVFQTILSVSSFIAKSPDYVISKINGSVPLLFFEPVSNELLPSISKTYKLAFI
jgi:hypothetical protein